MPRFLLDTQIVIRALSDPKRLSREQKRVFENAVRRNEPLALSAISLLEIAVLFGDGKLEGRLEAIFDALQTSSIFSILPLTCEVAADVAYLSVLRDPADRAIVAAARVHRLQLLTTDERIIDSKLVPVVE